MSKKQKDRINRIDYGLIIVFFVTTVLIFIGIKYQSDFIIGYFIPIAVCVITTLIFINYLTQVFSFSKNVGNKK